MHYAVLAILFVHVEIWDVFVSFVDIPLVTDLAAGSVLSYDFLWLRNCDQIERISSVFSLGCRISRLGFVDIPLVANLAADSVLSYDFPWLRNCCT